MYLTSVCLAWALRYIFLWCQHWILTTYCWCNYNYLMPGRNYYVFFGCGIARLPYAWWLGTEQWHRLKSYQSSSTSTDVIPAMYTRWAIKCDRPLERMAMPLHITDCSCIFSCLGYKIYGVCLLNTIISFLAHDACMTYQVSTSSLQCYFEEETISSWYRK